MSLDPLNQELPKFLENYLPNNQESDKPFVTLTYAQSLDSKISNGPGIRTVISDSETKTMTHYLRYHHDGILIGQGTVLADNPGLNCKWTLPTMNTSNLAHNSPTPIIIDLNNKWRYKGSKIEELYNKNEGKAPIIVVNQLPSIELQDQNVKYLLYKEDIIIWDNLFSRLKKEFQLNSIMVEGGANVINQLLLEHQLINSLIITIGSIFLGEKGVTVSPNRNVQLTNINWWTGKKDSILASNLKALN